MSTLKRSVPPSPTCEHATKRAKQASYAVPGDIIVVVDSDEEDTSFATHHAKPKEDGESNTDPELQDILAQIKAQEDSESDMDPELQDILAQIKAQEDSERLAEQLQDEEYEDFATLDIASVVSEDAMVIDTYDDFDGEDGHDDMQDILAQIKAQEDSEALAVQFHDSHKIASGSYSFPFSANDDSSEVEILPDPSQFSPSMSGISRSAEKQIGKLRDNGAREERPMSLVRPDEALGPLRDMFTRIRECTKCGELVKSPRGYVTFSETLPPPSLGFLLHAPCTSCGTNHCRGCFTPTICSASCKGTRRNSNCIVLSCCAEAKAIAIFETLGGLDREYILEQSASRSRASVIAKNAVKAASVGPGGTGYGTGNHNTSVMSKTTLSTTVHPAAETWERTVVRAMRLLINFLPAPYSDDPQVFDMLPHLSIGHLISLSQLPSALGKLLRNDSVTDWIARKETYNTMLSLLRRMADCELTIQCLIERRFEAVTTCGIEEWMWQDGEIVWSRNAFGHVETAPPLYSYFKKLTKQSESFQAGAMWMLAEEQDEADVEETIIQGTSLCGDIIAARDDLERAIAVLGQPSSSLARVPETHSDRNPEQSGISAKGKGRAVAIELDKAYAEACERLAFKHVSLADRVTKADSGLKYSSYNYAQELTRTQKSTRLPKDRFHLLKELAVTATSLPPGIWVRVDEVRNDTIKVMIAGPDSTPYAGGLFEFDCFLPLDYPNKPPLMHLRTTGRGSVRFNPNLYQSGKVCLSLLGTWKGSPEEQWNPGKSTLLQVLISIQSMILNDVPYFNEPGHGTANSSAAASIAYNKDISAKTVRWAIVDWLRDEHRDGIWRDVITSHFKIFKDKIRQRIEEWSQASPRIHSYRNNKFNYLSQKCDLLEQFDNGMKIIEAWSDMDDPQ